MMKKNIFKVFTVLALGASLTGCGESFLETDYYEGVDTETALSTVNNVSTALNGTYYNLFYYYFAGNYAVSIGDIPTDISYWNGKTGHFDDIYTSKLSYPCGLFFVEIPLLFKNIIRVF